MESTKHKVLFSFVCLQLLGAVVLAVAFYIELWPLELLVSFTPIATTLLVVALTSCSILILFLKSFSASLPLLAITGITWAAAIFILIHAFTAQKPVELATSNEKTITFASLNK